MEILCKNCFHNIPQHKGDYTGCWAKGCDCKGFKYPERISNSFYPCENIGCNHSRGRHTYSGGACYACDCRNYYHATHQLSGMCEFCHHDLDRHMLRNTGNVFTKCLACGCVPKNHYRELEAIEREKREEKRREQEKREARKRERELEKLREQARQEEIQREIQREKELSKLREKQWQEERNNLLGNTSPTDNFQYINRSDISFDEFSNPAASNNHSGNYNSQPESNEFEDTHGLVKYFAHPAIALSIIALVAFENLGLGIIIGMISSIPIWYYYFKNPTQTSKNSTVLQVKRVTLIVTGIAIWLTFMSTVYSEPPLGIPYYLSALIIFYILYFINNKLKI